MKCERCGAKGKLYQWQGEWLCSACLPKEAFEGYPIWKKRISAEKKK